MSLKSAIVMYRVDGVSGLNVLTGIKIKTPKSQPGAARPSILRPVERSVIGLPMNAVLFGSPERSAEYTNRSLRRNKFFDLWRKISKANWKRTIQRRRFGSWRRASHLAMGIDF